METLANLRLMQMIFLINYEKATSCFTVCSTCFFGQSAEDLIESVNKKRESEDYFAAILF